MLYAIYRQMYAIFLMNFYSFENLLSANMINIKHGCRFDHKKFAVFCTHTARTTGPGGVCRKEFNFGLHYHFHCWKKLLIKCTWAKTKSIMGSCMTEIETSTHTQFLTILNNLCLQIRWANISSKRHDIFRCIKRDLILMGDKLDSQNIKIPWGPSRNMLAVIESTFQPSDLLLYEPEKQSNPVWSRHSDLSLASSANGG